MSVLGETLSPQKFVERLHSFGADRLPFLFGPTKKETRLATPFSEEPETSVGAEDGNKSPFKIALENAVKFSPFGFSFAAGEAVATETQRVGQASARFISEATGGVKRGLQIATAILILLLGLWALGTARRVTG